MHDQMKMHKKYNYQINFIILKIKQKIFKLYQEASLITGNRISFETIKDNKIIISTSKSWNEILVYWMMME